MSSTHSPRIRTLVADDEPLVRERILRLVQGLPGLQVVAECRDGVETLDAIREHQPELVLLDIQMPELTGFQVLSALAPGTMPEIVFITAHDEYAIEAFDVNAVDYLLKPIQPERFGRAVDRAMDRLAGRTVRDTSQLEALASYVRSREHLDRFVVRSRGKYHFVPVQDVDWIEGAANYIKVHTGTRVHLVRGTLTAAEGRLDGERFARVHRSYIVNRDRMTSVEPLGHGEYAIHLPHDARVRTSRSYSDVVRRLLDGIE